MTKNNTKPDLLAVMADAGVDIEPLNGRDKANLRCPFHSDTGRPNMVVRADTQRWHCYRCGIGGDVFDFVGTLVFKDEWSPRNREQFQVVLQRLKEKDYPEVKPVVPEAAPRVKPAMKQALSLAASIYASQLWSPAAKDERAYLVEERRMSENVLRRLQVGYAQPGVLSAVLAIYPPAIKSAMIEAGVLDIFGKEWHAGRIVFPDVSLTQDVHNIVGRDRSAKGKANRYFSLPGLPKTLYLSRMANPRQPVILTESIPDIVNVWDMGLQGIAVAGTGIAWYLETDIKRFPIIGVLAQNDDAGMEAIERWQKIVPQARLIPSPLAPGNKDLNDLVKAVGLVEARKRLLASLRAANILIGTGK